MAADNPDEAQADEINNNDENTTSDSVEDFDLKWKDRSIFLVSTYWRGIMCLIVPVILIPILAPFPPEKYQWCAYTLMLMAIYWVTECIPLAITSFLPIVIFPLTGVMDTTSTCACYMNDTVMMFLGSMILAAAVEQSGLHKRMAICAIRAIGYSHYRLLFALSFMTMFISMWITNTAATTMMVPINFALLKVFEDQQLLTIFETTDDGKLISSDITTCYFCASTFSATIGGIGTLVGTATNLVFKGLFSKVVRSGGSRSCKNRNYQTNMEAVTTSIIADPGLPSFTAKDATAKTLRRGGKREIVVNKMAYRKAYPSAPEYLSFPRFSAFTIPYMLVMEFAMYLSLLIIYFGFLRPKSKAAERAHIPQEGKDAAKQKVDEDWIKLGRITFWEFMVIILFGGAMLMFFCRSPKIFIGWGDKIVSYYELNNYKFVLDSAAAMLVSFFMFLLPSNLEFFKKLDRRVETEEIPKTAVSSVLSWNELDRILPYSFMFLLGGGFALSEAAKPEYSDLNGKIGDILKTMKNLPNCIIILFIIIFTLFFTNFASNVAVCNVIAPIVMQLAKEINRNPLWYTIAAGLSASYCYCLPVGTPGNLIIQGAANISTGQMIKAGFGPTLTTILISWLAIYLWAPVVWPDLLFIPDWVT